MLLEALKYCLLETLKELFIPTPSSRTRKKSISELRLQEYTIQLSSALMVFSECKKIQIEKLKMRKRKKFRLEQLSR
jgi:hypothetical protein